MELEKRYVVLTLSCSFGSRADWLSVAGTTTESVI